MPHANPPLRILLIQSAYGIFASSGGYRANLAFCRAMAAQGHAVLMLAFPYAADLKQLPAGDVEAAQEDPLAFGEHSVAVYRFKFKGLDCVGLDAEAYAAAFDRDEMREPYAAWLETDPTDERSSESPVPPECAARRDFVLGRISAFNPTHVVVNERGSLKIATDAAAAADKQGAQDKEGVQRSFVRVFIAHDVNSLPFGPFSVFGDSALQHDRLRKVEGLWTVSEAVKAYFVQFGQLSNAKVLHNHPWIFADDPADLPFYDNWDKAHVTLINPGPAKGFPIAHAVARMAPDVNFIVIKSWATQPFVIEQFEQLENCTVEDSYTDIEELWRKTKVLMVPSLCYEAFGLVVVEAMLRGIPVISSDAGGLPEAHLGVPWVIPVNPFTEKETNPVLVERYGQWKLPENDPEPWALTLHGALWDQETYEAVRVQGRQAALDYLKDLDTGKYERWLRELLAAKVE
ncbi:hypothetical protein BDZ88DRAFT_405703 [Geranomyces variabilis]|nr:hypothetical protein BDZ88DRAFT_405703 [Geranomyces variabilis]KAJ3135496.1 hypothetical protein HDU90_003899 [Geranomyces variabilis]